MKNVTFFDNVKRLRKKLKKNFLPTKLSKIESHFVSSILIYNMKNYVNLNIR